MFRSVLLYSAIFRDLAKVNQITNFDMAWEMAYAESPHQNMAIAARENNFAGEMSRHHQLAREAGYTAAVAYISNLTHQLEASGISAPIIIVDQAHNPCRTVLLEPNSSEGPLVSDLNRNTEAPVSPEQDQVSMFIGGSIGGSEDSRDPAIDATPKDLSFISNADTHQAHTRLILANAQPGGGLTQEEFVVGGRLAGWAVDQLAQTIGNGGSRITKKEIADHVPALAEQSGCLSPPYLIHLVNPDKYPHKQTKVRANMLAAVVRTLDDFILLAREKGTATPDLMNPNSPHLLSWQNLIEKLDIEPSKQKSELDILTDFTQPLSRQSEGLLIPTALSARVEECIRFNRGTNGSTLISGPPDSGLTYAGLRVAHNLRNKGGLVFWLDGSSYDMSNSSWQAKLLNDINPDYEASDLPFQLQFQAAVNQLNGPKVKEAVIFVDNAAQSGIGFMELARSISESPNHSNRAARLVLINNSSCSMAGWGYDSTIQGSGYFNREQVRNLLTARRRDTDEAWQLFRGQPFLTAQYLKATDSADFTERIAPHLERLAGLVVGHPIFLKVFEELVEKGELESSRSLGAETGIVTYLLDDSGGKYIWSNDTYRTILPGIVERHLQELKSVKALD